eukprot:g1004.t1
MDPTGDGRIELREFKAVLSRGLVEGKSIIHDEDNRAAEKKAREAAAKRAAQREKITRMAADADFPQTNDEIELTEWLRIELGKRNVSAGAWFTLMDSDRSNSVGVNEFHQGLLSIGINVSYADSRKLFKAVDQGADDGRVDLQELADVIAYGLEEASKRNARRIQRNLEKRKKAKADALAARRKSVQIESRVALPKDFDEKQMLTWLKSQLERRRVRSGTLFNYMDADRSNSVGLNEFQTGLSMVGIRLTNDESKKLFNAFDTDGKLSRGRGGKGERKRSVGSRKRGGDGSLTWQEIEKGLNYQPLEDNGPAITLTSMRREEEEKRGRHSEMKLFMPKEPKTLTLAAKKNFNEFNAQLFLKNGGGRFLEDEEEMDFFQRVKTKRVRKIKIFPKPRERMKKTSGSWLAKEDVRMLKRKMLLRREKKRGKLQ